MRQSGCREGQSRGTSRCVLTSICGGASQRVVKFVRPKPVVAVQREDHERLLLVQRLLDPMEAGWQAALATGDVDRAWAFWTTTAEEALLALACPDITPDILPAGATLPLAPPHLPRGKGTDQLLREVRLCPKERRDTGGPLTCPVARIEAAQGPLREVLRWLERPAQGPGVMPRAVQQAWAALLRRLDRLRALGPEYVDFEPGGAPGRLAPLASLRRLSAALAGKVRATLRAEDKDRVQEWRAWLEDSWSSDRGAVYRWLKGESYAPPVTFLTRPDGTATANLAEMDALLQDAWRPINRKYALDPEPDPAAFLHRYGRHVQRVPMIALQLDGPRLRKGLSRMKPSALGLDGWSLADLRSLPDRLPGWLADLLREVERLGKWPTCLAEGYTALIPREGPLGPLNTRPLTVPSMVYRLWAGVTLVDAIAWQEAWAHPAAFGFRPARSALDRAAVTQVLLELCPLRGWAVAGMSIDCVKCFDLIPQAAVLAMALELGMDPGTCRALGAMYKQLRQAFKIAGTFGILLRHPPGVPPVGDPGECAHHDMEMGGGLPTPSGVRTNGRPPAGSGQGRGGRPGTGGPAPPQGCRPRLRRAGVVGLRGRHPGGALGAAAHEDTVPATEEWLRITGQDVRMDKSCSWVQGEQGAPAVLLRVVPIPLATTFRHLGVNIAIGGSKAVGPVLSRRLEAGRSALRRLPHLSTYNRRERAISTLVTPLALNGVAVVSVTEPNLRGVETAVVRALWGPARVSRAKELLFTVLSKGHRVSPIMHMRYERLLWLARLARRPEGHAGLCPGYLGVGGPPTRDGPVGARAPHGGLPGLDPARGLVVLGRPKAGVPPTLRAGAAPPAPAPSPGQPTLPLLAPVGGAVPRHLRGAGRRSRWPGLPRSAAGSLHGVGEVAATRAPGRSHVDGGPGVGPRHARQRRVPTLRRGARGRGPRPVGLPRVGPRQRNVAPLAERRGRGHPQPGPTGPVALLLAESGPFPPPAGAGGGPGPPGRVPVPPVWHVLGGPRGPNGGQRGGSAGPRRLPFPGAAASAAPQPLPPGCLRWPHTGGRRPPPAAAAAGGAGRLEVATGLHPQPGQVGPGASRGSGARGGLLGRAVPGL